MVFIAERPSARHLILQHCQPAFVCMYVCMYVYMPVMLLVPVGPHATGKCKGGSITS